MAQDPFQIMPHLFGNLVDLMDQGMGDPSSLIRYVSEGEVSPPPNIQPLDAITAIDDEYPTYKQLVEETGDPELAMAMAAMGVAEKGQIQSSIKERRDLLNDKKDRLKRAARMYHQQADVTTGRGIGDPETDPFVPELAKAFDVSQAELVKELGKFISPEEPPVGSPPLSPIDLGKAASDAQTFTLRGGGGQPETEQTSEAVQQWENLSPEERNKLTEEFKYADILTESRYRTPPGSTADQQAANIAAATAGREGAVTQAQLGAQRTLTDKEITERRLQEAMPTRTLGGDEFEISPIYEEHLVKKGDDPRDIYDRPKVYEVEKGIESYEIHELGEAAKHQRPQRFTALEQFPYISDKPVDISVPNILQGDRLRPPTAPGYKMFAVTDKGEPISEYKEAWIRAPWWLPQWVTDKRYTQIEAIQVLNRADGMTEEELRENSGINSWFLKNVEMKGEFDPAVFQPPAMEFIAIRMDEGKKFYVDPANIRPDIEKDLLNEGWSQDQINTLFVKVESRDRVKDSIYNELVSGTKDLGRATEELKTAGFSDDETRGILNKWTPTLDTAETEDAYIQSKLLADRENQVATAIKQLEGPPAAAVAGQPQAAPAAAALATPEDIPASQFMEAGGDNYKEIFDLILDNKVEKIGVSAAGANYYKHGSNFYVAIGNNLSEHSADPAYAIVAPDGTKQWSIGGTIIQQSPEGTGRSEWEVDPVSAVAGAPAAGFGGLPYAPVPWNIPFTEQWEAMRAQQMGDPRPSDPRWKSRMYGFEPAYGEYLLSGKTGEFADFVRREGRFQGIPRMTEEDRAKAFASLISQSAGDYDYQIGGGQKAHDVLTRRGYLEDKDQTVSMLMAAMGVGQGYGGQALRKTLNDEWDAFQATAVGTSDPVAGFISSMDKKYNLGVSQGVQ